MQGASAQTHPQYRSMNPALSNHSMNGYGNFPPANVSSAGPTTGLTSSSNGGGLGGASYAGPLVGGGSSQQQQQQQHQHQVPAQRSTGLRSAAPGYSSVFGQAHGGAAWAGIRRPT